MSWNYRVGTKFHQEKNWREFLIFECYYDRDGYPNGYADEINTLSGWDSSKELKTTHDIMDSAFDKPIIDLDDFPKIYESINHEDEKN